MQWTHKNTFGVAPNPRPPPPLFKKSCIRPWLWMYVFFIRMYCCWSTTFEWFENNCQVVKNNSEGCSDVLDWLDVMLEKENSNIVCCIVNVFLNVFLAVRMCCWWFAAFEWFEINCQVYKKNSEGGLDVLNWLDVKFDKESSNIYVILWMCFWMCFWLSECVVGGPLRLDALKIILR